MHIYIAEVTFHMLAQYPVPLQKRGMYTKNAFRRIIEIQTLWDTQKGKVENL